MRDHERIRRGALVAKVAIGAGLILGAACGLAVATFFTRTPKET